MGTDPTGLAAVLIAVITAGATLWAQRGGARARRQTVTLEQREQSLREFEVLREAAMQDVTEVRKEVRELRTEVDHARVALSEKTRVTDAASQHIKELRPMVPNPPGPPELPELLRNHGVGV